MTIFFILLFSCSRAQEGEDSLISMEIGLQTDNPIIVAGIITRMYAAREDGQVRPDRLVYFFYPFSIGRLQHNLPACCVVDQESAVSKDNRLQAFENKPVLLTGYFRIETAAATLHSASGSHLLCNTVAEVTQLEPVANPEELKTDSTDCIEMDLVFDNTMRHKDGFMLNGFICSFPDTQTEQCNGRLIRVKGWPQFFFSTEADLSKRDRKGKVVHAQGRKGFTALLHLVSVYLWEKNEWKLLYN